MNPSRSIAVALALLSATVLAGCQSDGGAKTMENRIRFNNGAFTGESSALGGDIKSILMAGGLDVGNPSAPTSDTNRAEIAKSNAASYDTTAMVAALSDTTTRSSSAAQTKKPATMVSAAGAEPTKNPEPSVALAMVAEAKPKPAPEKKIILESRVESETAPVIQLASINMSPSASGEAFDPVPAVEEVKPASASAPPDVKVATAAPRTLPEVVTAPGKTSRVRRF